MFEFVAERAIFSFDTHFLNIYEPTGALHIFDAIACYQAAYTFSELVNNALLPGLHGEPIKGDRFSMNAHCSEFFRASLLVSFAYRKQGFEWNASSMETRASRHSVFDQCYMSSKLRGADRGNVAAWACTKYEYVNCRCNISDYHTISTF
jgi:hypothetical protein